MFFLECLYRKIAYKLITSCFLNYFYFTNVEIDIVARYTNYYKKGVTVTHYVKCPNTEFFLVRIFLFSVQKEENRDQKKLSTWTLFTQCYLKQNVLQNLR